MSFSVMNNNPRNVGIGFNTGLGFFQVKIRNLICLYFQLFDFFLRNEFVFVKILIYFKIKF